MHYPPKYVLDEMLMYEIKSVMKYEYYSNKDNWEQARLISYTIALVNSKKKLKPADVVEFYWEKQINNIEKLDTTMSNHDLERLREKANTFKNLIYNNGC